MASSSKVEAGVGDEFAPFTEKHAEVEGALPAFEPNLSNVNDLKVEEGFLNDLSIAVPSTAATTHNNNNTVEAENAVPANDNDEQEELETNNDSGDDEEAPSIASTTNSTTSSASTDISPSTQVQMALLASHVRCTLNEIVAAENSLATVAAHEVAETAENLEQTTTRILALYMSVCDLFEEGGLERYGGYEMAATIRATIAEYPTIRGRCGI
ncbi:hypothetical protein BDBG_00120 [Blastomyces gilchristii SLH14081]|uniref:Uncharacterized protein n=2 Tax=Blastomyces TaxID=229219 RepID=A0A179U6M8_BLAGS|nr:uncharacterized protein BDBG_00120 [Blastomyces gilchristii SLH14081]EGE78356.1 hypothetical protein BDDG_01293 [Blastomyces dermatitidis ATCC 18188]EQL37556.1 hypothetical protein BDFG_01141 [Blastomyces dermatitidis ATCC 26199]OAT03393.1 hypothetical protein BDBG_00120 [Blastomyces gilchristii SLH14081]